MRVCLFVFAEWFSLVFEELGKRKQKNQVLNLVLFMLFWFLKERENNVKIVELETYGMGGGRWFLVSQVASNKEV